MERLTERRRREALALACLIITAGHAQAAGGQKARAVSSGAAAVADPMNLGFERGGLISPDSPSGWYVGGQGYNVSLDSVFPHSGSRSLRIRPTGTPPTKGFGVASSTISGTVTAGKVVRLRG